MRNEIVQVINSLSNLLIALKKEVENIQPQTVTPVVEEQTAQTAEAAKKKTRKPKAESLPEPTPAWDGEDAKRAEPADEPKAVEEPAKDEAVEAPAPKNNVGDVRTVLLRLVQKHGEDAARALLKKYGAARVSDIDTAKYDDFVAEAINEIGD